MRIHSTYIHAHISLLSYIYIHTFIHFTLLCINIYSRLHLECHLISISNLNLLGSLFNGTWRTWTSIESLFHHVLLKRDPRRLRLEIASKWHSESLESKWLSEIESKRHSESQSECHLLSEIEIRSVIYSQSRSVILTHTHTPWRLRVNDTPNAIGCTMHSFNDSFIDSSMIHSFICDTLDGFIMCVTYKYIW